MYFTIIGYTIATIITYKCNVVLSVKVITGVRHRLLDVNVCAVHRTDALWDDMGSFKGCCQFLVLFLPFRKLHVLGAHMSYKLLPDIFVALFWRLTVLTSQMNSLSFASLPHLPGSREWGPFFFTTSTCKHITVTCLWMCGQSISLNDTSAVRDIRQFSRHSSSITTWFFKIILPGRGPTWLRPEPPLTRVRCCCLLEKVAVGVASKRSSLLRCSSRRHRCCIRLSSWTWQLNTADSKPINNNFVTSILAYQANIYSSLITTFNHLL